MKPKRSTRLLLATGIAAPLVHGLALLIGGSLYPDYSHASQFISELGATGAPAPSILNFGGLVPAGSLTVILAFAMYKRYGPGMALALSSASVAAAGTCRLVAGLFPCDPGCSMENMSASARIHSVAGLAAFACGILAPVLFAVGIRVKHRRLFWLSLLCSAGALVAFAIGAQQGPGTPCIGLLQRLNLAFFYAWIVVLAAVGACDGRSERSA